VHPSRLPKEAHTEDILRIWGEVRDSQHLSHSPPHFFEHPLHTLRAFFNHSISKGSDILFLLDWQG
jgi:hypothetical protein